jgi:photosystem II stability/assembly factor-like uncharacterized protein
MGGRITSIAVHPSDPSVYWIGSSGGGLLKTINNGVDYEHQFTDQNTNSIGAVAVAPSNGDHVWIGTGENNPRNSVSWGDGVYRSIDGGETWEHVGLSESFQVSTIIVHPTDPETVYVGACGRLWGPSNQRGLYKTTDGGKAWEKVLSIDDKTGVIDIRMKPDDPSVLLAATYERERDIYCSNDPAKKWGPGSGVWRSEDAGESWVKVTEGLPSVNLGRVGLDWYVKDPSIVYAVVETERITQEPPDVAYAGLSGKDAEVGARVTDVVEESPAAEAGLEEDDIIVRAGEETIVDYDAFRGVIKAHKAGDEVNLDIVREGEAQTIALTFGNKPEREDNTDELGYPRSGPYSGGLGGQRENIQDDQGEEGHEYGGIYRSEDAGKTWARINSLNPRPMYYSEIRVDPSDENHVYVLGTSLYRSEDGGKTFTSDGARGSVHVDHHALWIDPNDGRHMILGNDGGMYVTWDRMERWDHHNHVAIGQFYNVTCGPREDYWVYGGLQDNGSWGGPSRSSQDEGPINTDWVRVGGGDGFVCRVDANDPNLVYYESQNGGMGRRDMATGEGGFVRPRGGSDEPRYRFNWNTPFILSNHNSRIHYSAGNYVFRSLDRGNRARRISPKVTTTERGSATSLHESPVDSDVLYVGTDDGGLWMTKDGGHTWVDLYEINAGLEPPANATPASFAPVSAAKDDPLTGTWTCKASGEGIEGAGEGTFTLELTLKDGKVSGLIDSEIGSGELAGLRWDAEKGELRFRFDSETLSLDFEADIDGDEIDGEISAAGGAFSFEFEGKRTSKAEATEETGEETDPEGDADPKEDPKEEPEEEPEDEGEDTEEAQPRFKKNTIDQLLPERRYVSSLTASRHKEARVYATFDGHRSDDDGVHVFVSNDFGETWESLQNNLTEGVGSVRDLDEDLESDDVLYLGTEFGAFVSIDKGDSWTELGENLPTVAVHDFAQHPTRGELIAGTHGRSIWIVDVSLVRQMSERSIGKPVVLYEPNDAIRWRRSSGRGVSGTRRFVGENPPSGTSLYYSLASAAKDLSLVVENAAGEVVREFPDAESGKGLHRIDWDLRKARSTEDRQGNRRFRRGASVPVGTYTIVLTVGEETLEETFEVKNDPGESDTGWTEFEEAWEEHETALQREEMRETTGEVIHD